MMLLFWPGPPCSKCKC